MCNLYQMKRTVAEVADLFRAGFDQGANFAAEIYPGYPGLVVAEGKARAMTWGFPRRLPTMKPTSKPKAVCNARDDKLTTFFWRDSFEKRRCLIPVSQWSEPAGEKGRMTKTWYRPAGEELFAVAGLWRPTDEWGDAYTMVMTDASAEMIEVHDRMPVILRPEEWLQWTDGSIADATALVKTWHGPLDVEVTGDKWGVASPPGPLL